MNQCFNIVYLAGGFTHALNDVLHGAERERLGVPVFKLTKDHWYPTPRKLRQDFLGAGVKLYAILARAFSVVNIHLMRAPAVFRCFSHAAISLMKELGLVDSAIQELAADHADLDLDHVEPAGTLRL
jgi:hypothetical protein